MRFRAALDWIDAVGVLVTLYGVIGLLYLLGAQGELVQLSAMSGALLAFPTLRRTVLHVPFRDANRTASAAGVLATLLIVFGTFASGVSALMVVVEMNPARVPPHATTPAAIGVNVARSQSDAERARDAADRAQELARLDAESREADAAEERRITSENRAKVPWILLVGLLAIAAVVAGGAVDRRISTSTTRGE